MSHSSVTPVKGAGVGDIELAHEFTKIAKRGFKKKVKMVIHKYITVKLDGIIFDRCCKYLKHFLPVGIISEDGFPFVSTTRYMINCTRILNAERSGHVILYHRHLALSTMKI